MTSLRRPSRRLEGQRSQIPDLKHQCCESGLTTFRVDLAAVDEGGLALSEREAFAIVTGNPAVSRQCEEELAETGFVRADLTARVEVQDIRVCFALAFGERDRRSELDLVWSRSDPFGETCVETEDLHRPILTESREQPTQARSMISTR